MNKAIVKNIYFILAISTFLLIIYFIPLFISFRFYITTLLFILYSIPVIVICFSFKRKNIVFGELAILIIFILLFIPFYRKLLDTVGPAEIGKSAVVGYSQYTGYPLYLDTFLFLLFILHPFIIILFFKLRDIIKNKK